MRRSRSSGFGHGPRPVGLAAALALVVGFWGPIATAAPAPGTIDRVSVPDGGGERNVLPTGSSLQCNAQNAGKCTKRAVAVDTANGHARTAPVTLDRIVVGGIVERGVPALIAQPGQLKTSLLGMSFLNRLRSSEVRGDKLVLRGN